MVDLQFSRILSLVNWTNGTFVNVVSFVSHRMPVKLCWGKDGCMVEAHHEWPTGYPYEHASCTDFRTIVYGYQYKRRPSSQNYAEGYEECAHEATGFGNLWLAVKMSEPAVLFARTLFESNGGTWPRYVMWVFAMMYRKLAIGTFTWSRLYCTKVPFLNKIQWLIAR